MSYLKKWCPGAESNHRHEDFQSTALPLSYPGTGDRRHGRVSGFYGFDEEVSSIFFDRPLSGQPVGLVRF